MKPAILKWLFLFLGNGIFGTAFGTQLLFRRSFSATVHCKSSLALLGHTNAHMRTNFPLRDWFRRCAKQHSNKDAYRKIPILSSIAAYCALEYLNYFNYFNWNLYSNWNLILTKQSHAKRYWINGGGWNIRLIREMNADWRVLYEELNWWWLAARR